MIMMHTLLSNKTLKVLTYIYSVVNHTHSAKAVLVVLLLRSRRRARCDYSDSADRSLRGCDAIILGHILFNVYHVIIKINSSNCLNENKFLPHL